MTEVLETVMSTVQGLTAAASHQQQQQQLGEHKPEQQQSSIDMESQNIAPVEPPNVRMHMYMYAHIYFYDVFIFGLYIGVL